MIEFIDSFGQPSKITDSRFTVLHNDEPIAHCEDTNKYAFPSAWKVVPQLSPEDSSLLIEALASTWYAKRGMFSMERKVNKIMEKLGGKTNES